MSGSVATIVIEVLKRIQADIAALRGDVEQGFAETGARFAGVEDRIGRVEGRLSVVEDALRRQRRDLAGLLVIAKSAAGDLALQIEAVERRTAALEGAR